ncbi:MAG TPA: hypothetical protein VMK65_11980, partial [Longimicrobiales bacterium]|nr:hypothetical protein [Longimicrobiales bacterium]
GIRVGAEEVVHGAYSLHTGEPLRWEVVDGTGARRMGHPRAGADRHYIMVDLPRPVPEGGEGRLRIVKTYTDANSYFADGEEIVFRRNLGIWRNAVVLPRGWELVSVNFPSQVMMEPDGRIKVSFTHAVPGGVDYEVRARPLPARAVAGLPSGPAADGPGGSASAGKAARTTSSDGGSGDTTYAFPERAFADREIVYFLQPPETHAFRLYHDYTETRPGVGRYLPVVRPGSRATDPSATLLDTGEALPVETLRGPEIAAAGIAIGGASPETEVVLIRFPAVEEGRSARLRIWETYTDPGRYFLDGETLVWDRTFGRARNRVVLPEGWWLTDSAVPALVEWTEDGRVALELNNDRDDQIRVYLRARRR